MALITKQFKSDSPRHAVAALSLEVVEVPAADIGSTHRVDAIIPLSFDNGSVTKSERFDIAEALSNGEQTQLAAISRKLYDHALQGIVAKGPSRF